MKNRLKGYLFKWQNPNGLLPSEATYSIRLSTGIEVVHTDIGSAADEALYWLCQGDIVRLKMLPKEGVRR